MQEIKNREVSFLTCDPVIRVRENGLIGRDPKLRKLLVL